MKRFSLIVAALVLVFFFAVPEFILWSDAGQGLLPAFPVRNYEGDSAHYLSVARSAILDGHPNSNAYFLEPTDTHSQFFLAQTAFTFVAPILKNFSVVWLDLLLRIFVAIATFLLLGKILESYGVPWHVAFAAGFSFTAVFGPTSFHGYALGFWFFPLLLAAFYCTKRFTDFSQASPLAAAYSIAALLISAVHPVYFTLFGCANLIAWLHLLFESRWSSRSRLLFTAWALVGLGIFGSLFAHFIFGSTAGTDTVMRIVGIKTRLLIHPIYTFGLLFLAWVGWSLGFTRAIAYSSVAACVGLLSYMATGTYIANDHYATPFEDVAVFILFIVLVWTPLKIDRKKVVIWGSIALFLFLCSLLENLRYLGFRLGYFGRYVPVVMGYGGIAALFLVPRSQEFFKRIFSKRFALYSIMIASLLYGGILMHKENAVLLPTLAQDEAYRPLVEELQKLPAGVILGDSTVLNITSLYTQQKTYWHPIAFSETVSDAELATRWEDAYLFFADDPEIGGVTAGVRVLGTTNRCTDHARDDYYRMLSEAGFDSWEKVLCEKREELQSTWPAFLKEATEKKNEVIAGVFWKPHFALQYLVLDTENDFVDKQLLNRFWQPLTVAGTRFQIYILRK